MNNTPLVSVILNVYNGEDYVADAIQSVLDQTYENLELIVADDASSDNTLAIIRGFDDPRLHCLTRTTRRHICYTINEALDQAKGDWIAHIDHDDIWEKDKLEKQIAYVLAHPEVGACFSYVNLIGPDGQDVRDQYPDIYDLFHISFDNQKDWVRYLFFNLNCLCHPSSLIRADLMPKQDLFCRQLHDCLMWCQLVSKTEFYVYPEELVRYRWAITKEKASHNTHQNLSRTYNEMLMVTKDALLSGLTDRQFIDCFREDFVNPDSASPLELKIEKMFLLEHCGGSINGPNALSMRYLKEILHTEGGLELLEQNYKFSLLSLYQATGNDLFFTPRTEVDLQQLRNERDSYRSQLENLYLSRSWRITAPIRAVTERIYHTDWLLRLIRKIRLRFQGRSTRVSRGERRALAQWNQAWLARGGNPLSTPASFFCTQEEYEAQTAAKFPRDITFSVLVPLYNTPEQYLREMIASVQNQTYPKWELCLADGSDGEHGEVGRICRELAARDSRIHYQKLEKNLGISGNTNACIAMAQGDYIALFDHDDLLHPSALYEDMVAICERDADFIYTDENTFHKTPADAYCPHFKPDYAPDTLRANNYICHFTAFSRELQQKVGFLRPECDGSQDFDMVLRLTEQAQHIVHIPKILYYWRAHEASVASDVSAKPYVIEAAHKAVSDHLKRVGLPGQVLDSVVPSIYRLKYDIPSMDLVSIVICTKDHADDLKKCIDSILEKTTYPDYEIVVVENNSTEAATFAYYRELEQYPRIRVVTWSSPTREFNYSAINNFGVTQARGEYILLLNNDTEVISPDWLQEMVMYAQRPDVGAVGAKLYYPDDTIQHAGIGIGLLTLAGHYHRGFARSHPGYMGRLIYAQDVSAVTAACILIRRSVWNELGGLDAGFKVAFNDIDFCMRVRRAGYLIVWTPYAELYHYESKSRGLEDTPEKQKRFQAERQRFYQNWTREMAAGDPYYNPNFSLEREDFSLRIHDRRR